MRRIPEWVVEALVLVAIIVLMVALAGCDGRRQGYPLRPDVAASDPTAYSGLLYEGKWQRDSAFSGYAWLNAWDDSTIDCIAYWRGWSFYGPAYDPDRYRGDHLRGVAVFSIHVNLDSTLSSKLQWVGLKDSNGVANLPLPDSLGALAFKVEGHYASIDSFFLYQVYDSTLAQWVNVWTYEPVFNIRVTSKAAKLEERTIVEKLRRIGPHGEPRPAAPGRREEG